MNAASPTVCPKCGYTRKPEDAAPAWQCPSCGIAYNKFRESPAPAERAAGPEDLRVRTRSVGRRDRAGSTALAAYASILAVLVMVHLFNLGQTGIGVIKWLPVALAACAFFFWQIAYRRLRMVVDVPRSAVAAAAQGYTELRGIAVAATGDTLIGHLSRVPCVWYRFYCWIQIDGENQHQAGELGTWFMLRDDTGDCVINANEAEVVCDRCQHWGDFNRTCQEWSIRAGDPVYVIGHFTSGGAAAERHLDMKAAHALAAQERDKASYIARYDITGDGKVGPEEAAIARAAMRRDTEREYAARGGVHTLGSSPDGRPFLVIGGGYEYVVSRYRRLAIFHLGVFLASLGAAACLWNL